MALGANGTGLILTGDGITVPYLCDRPVDPEVVMVTDMEAKITWERTDESATSTEVSYRKTGDTAWTYHTSVRNFSYVTVKNLPGGEYTFRLRSICGTNIYSFPVYTTAVTFPDYVPDAFVFVDQTDLNTSTLTESNVLTPTGFTGSVPISVTNGEYQIDTGTWTSISGTFTLGQTVKVRHTTSGAYSTSVNTVLTIGEISDTFTTTTKVAPPVTMTYSHTKSTDPHVDIIIVPVSDGVNRGNVYATSTGSISGILAGHSVTIALAHSSTSVLNPYASTGRLQILKNSVSIFDSGNVTAEVDTLTSYTFTAEEGAAYEVISTSAGDTTNYKPVNIIQVNNSSAPFATGHPVPVEFEIKDNTDAGMVFKDGTYTQNQTNGFNFLDDVNQGTIVITNRHTASLRFLIQNGDGTVTHWSDVDVDQGSNTSFNTLPKESVKITYTDTPETFTTNEIGVLVVDIYDQTYLDVVGLINTPGVSVNNIVAHRDMNFVPNDGTSAANCWILASDLINTGSSLRWRFEFNIEKLMLAYPAINQFVFEIRGAMSDGGVSRTTTGLWSTKSAVGTGTMIMNGSEGSYIPSVENMTNVQTINTSYTLPSGSGAPLTSDLPIICTFTYDRTTKVMTKS